MFSCLLHWKESWSENGNLMVLISLEFFFLIIQLLKALFSCFRSTNSVHPETERGPELERSCKIIPQRSSLPLERHHTNTTPKTRVPYDDTHLACEVHKLHQRYILSETKGWPPPTPPPISSSFRRHAYFIVGKTRDFPDLCAVERYLHCLTTDDSSSFDMD